MGLNEVWSVERLMRRPYISIIIPCFNAEPWIRETLESILSQCIDDMEIIVVDDGSTDNSAKIIKREFPNARIVSGPNRGPSYARNLGTYLSKGEFLQYCDADDLLAPGKLKRQLQVLEMTKADIAYGDWQRLRQRPDGTWEVADVICREIHAVHRDVEIALLTDFWCPPAVYLFRRDIVEKVGGWDERFRIIEDVRFMLDCALRGARFVYCPGIMAYHRTHSSGSASTRDPVGFVRCCFKNVLEVEQWWREHGGITEDRKEALVKVYGYVARASFERDPETFESVYGALERLCPGYVPSAPRLLAVASKILGYRRAEFVAMHYRRLKRFAQRFRVFKK